MAMAENRLFLWQHPLLVGCLAGLLAGMALPPQGWPPLLWLALVPLWGLGPLAAGAGAAVAVLVSHRWLLWLHPLDWLGVPGPLSLPLCLALWGACGLLAGLLVAGWRALVGRLGPERPATALGGAALWGLVEVALARGPLFWLGLGSAALPGDRPLAGLALAIGAGGLAAIQLLLAWGLWRVLLAARTGRAPWRRLALFWCAAVVALHGLGWGLLAAESASSAKATSLLILQPAIPTRHKFEFGEQQRLLQRLAAAQQEGGERGVEAVLLPEGSLALGQALPLQAPVEVLSGGFRLNGGDHRSSLLRFEPDRIEPAGWVDKHRLVPLGEWVPLAGLFEWSGLSAVGGLTPGKPSRLLPRPLGAIGVAICYEIADGHGLAAASRDGAQWLLASANLDPYPLLLQQQFSALAQLRAIESGRWLVSVANTGPSLVVNHQGVVQRSLPPGRASTGLVEVHQRYGPTTYARWGEWPLVVLGLGGLAARGRRTRFQGWGIF
jgi:apolipoprotein N-acyltransferase